MANPKGPAIEHYRVDLGMSRRDLANLARLDYRTIYGYERGHTFKCKRPTAAPENLKRVADVLKVGLYDVMEREEARGDKAPADAPDTAASTDEAADAGTVEASAQEEVSAA